MTSKEKAKELTSRFFQYTQRKPEAVLCAVLCVEEMLDEVNSYIIVNTESNFNEFYSEVLNELHKL